MTTKKYKVKAILWSKFRTQNCQSWVQIHTVP